MSNDAIVEQARSNAFFESDNGGTPLVTGRSAFPTFQARDLYLTGGADRGLAESHDRLEELLSALASRPRERQGQ